MHENQRWMLINLFNISASGTRCVYILHEYLCNIRYENNDLLLWSREIWEDTLKFGIIIHSSRESVNAQTAQNTETQNNDSGKQNWRQTTHNEQSRATPQPHLSSLLTPDYPLTLMRTPKNQPVPAADQSVRFNQWFILQPWYIRGNQSTAKPRCTSCTPTAPWHFVFGAAHVLRYHDGIADSLSCLFYSWIQTLGLFIP